MNQADQNVVPGPTAPSARYEEGAVTLSPEEARKLDARLAKVRDAYFRRLPESDPGYDEMQDLLKKACTRFGGERDLRAGRVHRGQQPAERQAVAGRVSHRAREFRLQGFGLCQCDGARGDGATRRGERRWPW